MVQYCQSVPLAFFVIASKEEFIRPNTTKMPPTIAQIEIIKRDRSALDLVIDIETGENSKIIMTMFSWGYRSAGFLLIVKA